MVRRLVVVLITLGCLTVAMLPLDRAHALRLQVDPRCAGVPALSVDDLAAAGLQPADLPAYRLVQERRSPPEGRPADCAQYLQMWTNPANAPFVLDLSAPDALIMVVTLISHPADGTSPEPLAANPHFSDFAPLSGIGDEALLNLVTPPPNWRAADPVHEPALVGTLIFRRGSVTVRIDAFGGAPDTFSSQDLSNWAALIDMRLGTGLP